MTEGDLWIAQTWLSELVAAFEDDPQGVAESVAATGLSLWCGSLGADITSGGSGGGGVVVGANAVGHAGVDVGGCEFGLCLDVGLLKTDSRR